MPPMNTKLAKITKFFLFLIPMQLLIRKQWWSNYFTH